MNTFCLMLTSLSLFLLISLDLLKLLMHVLHVFIGPLALGQWLSARIFQPLLTQMNNRSGLLSCCPLHFLIHLHDSIYFPFKRELCLNFRLRTFLGIYCIISQRFILIEKHSMQVCICQNVVNMYFFQAYNYFPQPLY